MARLAEAKALLPHGVWGLAAGELLHQRTDGAALQAGCALRPKTVTVADLVLTGALSRLDAKARPQRRMRPL
jgi:hypothetical protein